MQKSDLILSVKDILGNGSLALVVIRDITSPVINTIIHSQSICLDRRFNQEVISGLITDLYWSNSYRKLKMVKITI